MARSVWSTMSAIQRDMNRAQAQHVRAHNSAVAQAERARAAAVREAERARRALERAHAADERERARLYAESRAADVAADNEALTQRIEELSCVLESGLEIDSYVDLPALKAPAVMPAWEHQALEWPEPAPDPARYTVDAPTGMSKLFGSKAHNERVAAANAAYVAACEQHARRDAARLATLEAERVKFERAKIAALATAKAQHDEIDQLAADLDAGQVEAVLTLFELALNASALPEGFPAQWRLAYVPNSRQLVIEYELPRIDIVPAVKAYRYIKARDEVTSTARPATQVRALYASVLSQLCLRVLAELFGADRGRFADTIVFNGMLSATDPRTGQPAHPCLVTVRTTREQFSGLDLSAVDPAACLKHLSASVSRSPAELEAVRPVLEFSMVDERFVEQDDVLGHLDQRPNLMELSPTEFEALIANLFAKMGLDTRQTRPSRDGGVDCVAFDQRAILGGKVVIQAKRYRHTVGVSAVRDLYGTVMNEGASKGILVTTSGYGRASMEFAAGKPLELLDGANLLSLLADHAGVDAKIVMPEDWRDPRPDSPDTGQWATTGPEPTASAVSTPPAATTTPEPTAGPAPAALAPARPSPRPSPGPYVAADSFTDADTASSVPGETDTRPRCTNPACAHVGEPVEGRQCQHCFHYVRT